MRKSRRNLDWLLLGLIGMCPMGAIAYYNARAEEEEHEHVAATRAPHHSLISETTQRSAVVRLAVL